MRPIDEYIVRMQLDNERFKKNASESVTVFEQMKSLFSKDTPTNSLESIASGMDTLVSKFSAGNVIFRRVLDNMVDAAMRTGRKLARAITEPLLESGKNRALAIEQAKFQFEGLGMDVEATMDSANTAVLGTAFGLDEAATAAAMFGASGMRAGEEMTTSLRAISGVAAMTGSAYGDIANVFTSVAGNGRVMGNDLLRLSSRGINAAATLADHLEMTEAQVREMVTKGQIDFEMFSEAMDTAFGEHATKSSETYKGALSLVSSAIQRIGADWIALSMVAKRNVFNALWPQINQLRTALSPLTHAFGDLMMQLSDFSVIKLENLNLNPLIESIQMFVDLGGVKSIGRSFENLGRTYSAIMNPMSEAMKNFIPPDIPRRIVKGFESIEAAFGSLAGFIERHAAPLESAFTGIFSILDLGLHIAKEVAGVFISMFPSGLVSDSIHLAGSFGDMATAFAESVKEGELLPAVLEGIGKGLGFISDVASSVSGVVTGLFKGMTPAIEVVWELLKNIGSFAGGLFQELFGGISVGDIMDVGLAYTMYEVLTSVMGALEKIFGIVKDTGIKAFFDGLADSVTSVIDSVTESLSAMTTAIKVKTLMSIATSIGILAVSLKLLQGLSVGDITKGLGAITGSLVAMVVALNAINKIDMSGFKSLKTVTMLTGLATATVIMAGALKTLSTIDEGEMSRSVGGLIATTTTLVTALYGISKMDGLEVGAIKMIGVATAVRILAGALKSLSKMEWNEIAKGLVGLSGTMVALGAFMKVVDGTKVSIGSATAMVIVSAAVSSMVRSISKIGNLSWGELSKGLVGISGILASLTVFSKTVNPSKMLSTSVSMVIIGSAIRSMTGSVEKLAGLRLTSLVKGIGGLSAVLASIVAFSHTVDATSMIPASAAMLVMAGAIKVISGPVKEFGEMGTGEMVQGVSALAGVLGTLVIAVNASTGGLVGSAAMVVMAGALNLMIVPLKALGNMSLWELTKSIGGLAAALLVLGGVGSVLGAASPLLMLFGGALAFVGTGIGLAGIGMKAFATSLEILAGLTVTSFGAITEIISIFLDALLDNMPKAITIIKETLVGMIEAIAEAVPDMVNAGLDLILGLLTGIRDRIGEFIDVGVDIIVLILQGIADNAPTLLEEGVLLMISLINGMADTIRDHGPEMTTAMLNIFGEILIVVVDAGVQVISALFGWIPGVDNALDWVGKNATEAIRGAFGAEEVGKEKGEDFASGITSKESNAREAGKNLGTSTKDSLGNVIFDPEGQEAGNQYITGVSSNDTMAYGAGRQLATKSKDGSGSVSLYDEGYNTGDGFVSGLSSSSLVTKAWNAAKNLAITAKNAVSNALNMKSPSRVTMEQGKYFGEGLIIGISDTENDVWDAAGDLASAAMESLRSTAEYFASVLDGETDLQPVVTPVLDMSNFDYEMMNRELQGYGTSVNARYNGVYGRSNQNGNIPNNRTSDRVGNNQPIEYHAHLNVQGSLPKSTIDRMAKDFDNALKRMDDSERLARGEDVRY